MSKRPKSGAVHHVEEKAPRNFGSAPNVGQSKPYQSGSNARGKHERPTQGAKPGSGGVSPASQPRQSGYKG